METIQRCSRQDIPSSSTRTSSGSLYSPRSSIGTIHVQWHPQEICGTHQRSTNSSTNLRRLDLPHNSPFSSDQRVREWASRRAQPARILLLLLLLEKLQIMSSPGRIWFRISSDSLALPSYNVTPFLLENFAPLSKWVVCSAADVHQSWTMNQHLVLSLPGPPQCPKPQSRVSSSVDKTFAARRRPIPVLDTRAASTLPRARSPNTCATTKGTRDQAWTLRSINSLNGLPPIAAARAIRSQNARGVMTRTKDSLVLTGSCDGGWAVFRCGFKDAGRPRGVSLSMCVWVMSLDGRL